MGLLSRVGSKKDVVRAASSHLIIMPRAPGNMRQWSLSGAGVWLRGQLHQLLAAAGGSGTLGNTHHWMREGGGHLNERGSISSPGKLQVPDFYHQQLV